MTASDAKVPNGQAAERNSVPVEVAVIGAGPGGICAAVGLKAAGIEDFVVLERADRIGGTWRDNTYPGIGVDIPSIAYQFSFARKPDWSWVFARGAEVQAYHEDVVERFGLLPHLRFGHDVVRETWEEDARRWRLELADGRVVHARFVINAIGAFRTPKDPDIPGLSEFQGTVLRPTEWDHGLDLTGKRVAVIGTGASSVQIVPAIAPAVGHLDVYMRTPIWCLPKPDVPVPEWARTALGVPGVAATLHGGVMLGLEAILCGLVYTPGVIARPAMNLMDSVALQAYRRRLRHQVRDEATRAALTPTFGPVVKRPTMSNTFLSAFDRDNVDLVTAGVAAFTESGVRLHDGSERAADVVVLATGYELFADPESYRPGAIVGRHGFDLAKFFAEEGMQAYESVAVAGLPNRWMLVGPYSWSGSGWHGFVERTARHAIRMIGVARQRGAEVVEVRAEAQARYHRKVVRRSRNLHIYFNEINAGVRTYYVNSQGRMAYIRPSTNLEAWWRSGHSPLGDYAFECG